MTLYLYFLRNILSLFVKGIFFTLPVKVNVFESTSPNKNQFVQQLFYRETRGQFDHLIF